MRDEADRSVVTLRGDGLFAPGSAQVDEQYGATLQHVARALNAVPGQVRVTGHTDNQPIRSPRFPSNWHLSQDARRCGGGAARRARRRSRAACAPKAAPTPSRWRPNGTPEQRARNRRVEIMLAARAARDGRDEDAAGADLQSLGHRRCSAWCAIGLLVWLVGPLVAIADCRPLESERVRWIVIGAGRRAGASAACCGSCSRRSAPTPHLIEGLLRQRAPRRADAPAPGAEEVALLQQRFEQAVTVLKQARLGGAGKPSALARLTRQ